MTKIKDKLKDITKSGTILSDNDFNTLLNNILDIVEYNTLIKYCMKYPNLFPEHCLTYIIDKGKDYNERSNLMSSIAESIPMNIPLIDNLSSISIDNYDGYKPSIKDYITSLMKILDNIIISYPNILSNYISHEDLYPLQYNSKLLNMDDTYNMIKSILEIRNNISYN